MAVFLTGLLVGGAAFALSYMDGDPKDHKRTRTAFKVGAVVFLIACTVAGIVGGN